jgi:hypothetical protein
MPGCAIFGPDTWDTSYDKDTWRAYRKDQVYVLRKPVYFIRGEFGDMPELAIPGYNNSGHGVRYPDTMMAEHEWKAYPEIQGVLPAGTKMQAVKTIRFESINVSVTQVIMKILDGPFTGRLVSANALNKPNPPYEYDPDYLGMP